MRIVIKIGTKVITSKDRALDKERVKDMVSQISAIRKKGIDVLIVTSGAIGAGMWLLGIKKRPADLSELQAVAAIGQNYLMKLYGEYFKAHGSLTGQILLTQDDFNDRKRYLNIKHTIGALLKYNAVPIINENDTVATEEIKCGDNDRLSSLVADIAGCDKLILLTDVDGLLDEHGSVIGMVGEVNQKILKLGGRSVCDLGTGGMATKLQSARAAQKAGIECIIANGKAKDILSRLVLDGDRVGTRILSANKKFDAKKRWIAYSSMSRGAIRIDDGARTALIHRNKSLLASGIVEVSGDFVSGDVISISDKDGHEFAKGLSNYSADEVEKLKGLKSVDFKNVLGYKAKDEIVHKDNLVIL
ncbi:MAG: glutamate 5-kinase [Candidatus Omnitrophica bacterium]|nr:glutamate 5-kinase [Candidatus Omnitrophota bacterium]